MIYYEVYHVYIFSGTLTLSTIGLMFGLIYAAYGVGFWYGLKMILDYRENHSDEYMSCFLNCTSEAVNGNVDVDCFQNCDK